MAKKRKKRRTAAQKRATKRMLAANKRARKGSKTRSKPVAKKKRSGGKRRRRSSGAGKSRRRSSRRGSTAVPILASLAGAGATVGGLWALRKYVESKQKTDPSYTLPELVTTGAPLAGAGLLYVASKFGKVSAAKPYVAPAIAAGAAFLIANFLNKPKGAGARRLRGSGASAARANLARERMQRLPGGAGASAASAALRRA